jgi:hypothetical protein
VPWGGASDHSIGIALVTLGVSSLSDSRSISRVGGRQRRRRKRKRPRHKSHPKNRSNSKNRSSNSSYSSKNPHHASSSNSSNSNAEIRRMSRGTGRDRDSRGNR